MPVSRPQRRAPSKPSASGAAKPAPSARPTRRKRDAEVLEAAVKVFYERGYAAASIQDIADELGILKGSLYHYIRTKEDLLFRLLEHVHDEVAAVLAEVSARTDLEPLERLHEYVRQQAVYNTANLARISIYYDDLNELSPPRREEILHRRKPHERFVASLILAAQEQGLASDDQDPTVLTNFVFGTLIWPYRWYRPGGELTSRQLAQMCADFAVAGVVGAAAPQLQS